LRGGINLILIPSTESKVNLPIVRKKKGETKTFEEKKDAEQGRGVRTVEGNRKKKKINKDFSCSKKNLERDAFTSSRKNPLKCLCCFKGESPSHRGLSNADSRRGGGK